MNATAAPSPAPSALQLQLREHQIGYFLPDGAKTNGVISLPHGALICGQFFGRMHCEHGSVIIAKTAKICGYIEADRIYVEGNVHSPKEGERSRLVGRWLVAASSSSRIVADLASRAFALHQPKLWGSLMTIEEHLQSEGQKAAHTAG